MISRLPLRRVPQLCLTASRTYATGTNTTAPMLLKIRKDLKTAMQQKDTPRLTVLRTLLAAALNASKTSTPITTDIQMLSLLRKTAQTSKSSVEDFQKAGREDLVQKEEAQIKVLDEYVGGVEVVGEEEVREVVRRLVGGMKGEGELKLGDVLKRVFGKEEEGGLGERNVERGEVAKIVKEALAKK